MWKMAIAAAIGIALVGCAPVQPASPTSTDRADATSLPMTTTASRATPTSSGAATTTTSPRIDIEFADGEVTGTDVVQVPLGETVDLWVLSDVDDEIHVHGYDLVYELTAGVPFNLTFPADIPGVFEVEIHTGHTQLFELEVAG